MRADRKLVSVDFRENRLPSKPEMLSIGGVFLYRGLVLRVLEYAHLVTQGGKSTVFLRDMARVLKGTLPELTLGKLGLEIPTYVRGDNSDALYQVASANTANSA